MSSNLALKLRAGTQKAHTAAENVGFMKCFLKGVVDKNCFAKFLGNLYFVYIELETALASHQNNPVVGGVYFPELNRRASLEKDMVFYYGNDWRSLITPSNNAKKYIACIQQLSASEPAFTVTGAVSVKVIVCVASVQVPFASAVSVRITDPELRSAALGV